MEEYKELIKIIDGVLEKDDAPTLAMLAAAADAIEQLIKERDAAIADISWLMIHHYDACRICKHNTDDEYRLYCPTCDDLILDGNFEWRGVQNERT